MLKIKVWYKECESSEESYCRELRNLKPRRYMCGWDFERLLKYISKELYWEDIKEELIEEIVIFSEKEQWQQPIRKVKGE